MAENLNTTEARAVQKYFDQLMTAIQEPQIPALAAAFFSGSIVSSDTMQFVTNVAVSKAVRCTALLLAVVNHVEVHPGKFEQVVGILSQETNLIELATRMSETYRMFNSFISLQSFSYLGWFPAPSSGEVPAQIHSCIPVMFFNHISNSE